MFTLIRYMLDDVDLMKAFWATVFILLVTLGMSLAAIYWGKDYLIVSAVMLVACSLYCLGVVLFGVAIPFCQDIWSKNN